MFRVEMLPAKNGDCLWIEYGDVRHPHRVLVDGGTAGAIEPLIKKVTSLPKSKREFELLVVTHVDIDHIAGILKFLDTPGLEMRIKEIWFNAYKHLDPDNIVQLGAPEGEKLSALIEAVKGLTWNGPPFDGGAVMVPDVGGLPVRTLEGGLEIVVVGPTFEKLQELKPVWIEECKRAGIIPGEPEGPEKIPAGLEIEILGGEVPDVDVIADVEFKEDIAEANGSSIVLLLRYGGKSVLLGADGHPSVIEAGLRRLHPGSARIKVDAYKVAHHGSRHNTNETLVKLLACRRYLFSSSGTQHKHPNPEAVARVLKYARDTKQERIDLIFNYYSDSNKIWDDDDLRTSFNYKTKYPASDGRGAVLVFRGLRDLLPI